MRAPQDQGLFVAEAGWSTGFCPWSEAVEAEGLSVQIVQWELWAVGLIGTVWDVEMTVTPVCVGERMGWRRLIMKSPEEPEE